MRARLGWAMVVGLGLTGCPAGASLDTPFEEYEPVPTTVDNTITNTATATSTTSSDPGCDDSNVDDTMMVYWCGSSACHGTPASSERAGPVWLFSPDRTTELLDLPAEWENCGTELVVNTAAPEKSLILTSINETVPPPCDVDMPKGIELPDEEYKCIEQWVYSLVAGTP